MAEGTPRSETPQDRAASAAEKLRALRDRASQTLDDHRRRLGALETELSQRVQQLADDYDAGSQHVGQVEATKDAEIATLRQQLAESEQKHKAFTDKLAETRRQLEQLKTLPCSNCDASVIELSAARDEVVRLSADLAAASSRHDEDKQRLDLIVAQLGAARAAIDDLAKNSDVRVAELSAELESLRGTELESQAATAAAIAEAATWRTECEALGESMATLTAQSEDALEQGELLQQQLAAAAAESAQAASEREALQSSLNQSQADAESLRSELASAIAQRDALQSAASANTANHDATTQQLVDQIAAATAECNALQSAAAMGAARIADLESALTVTTAERDDRDASLAGLRAELDEARTKLSDAQGEIANLKSGFAAVKDKSDASAERHAKLQSKYTAAEEELAELKRSAISAVDLTEARRERDEAVEAARQSEEQRFELLDALRDAQGHIERLLATMCPLEAMEELQQKFDLALADVQKLKRENSSLREEVSSRPESDEQESPDLVAVRAERDELASRVAELESAAPACDTQGLQQIDDIQRRFELAVDDVRQLKKENAALREKLSTGSGVVTQGASCPLDWASQKARLLAQLQDEDSTGVVDPERENERATVQGTIAVTDRVIAEKESEVAELLNEVKRLQAIVEQPLQVDPGAATEEILAADELVAAERQKLAALQSQWEEKLRSAELEFAVERANLARQQAALRDKQLDLDRLTQQTDGAADGSEAKRRRRWLDALGLRDEEGKSK